MSEKTKMSYRVYAGYNPKTGGTMLRPVVTHRNTMSLKQLVEFAKTANYVTGQQKNLEGLLGGFIQAMQDRSKAGYTINVNDWFIISGQLKGPVGNDFALTDANDYHVTITASKDLKVGIDNFSWTCVSDTSKNISIDGISSPNGNLGEITKTKAIIVNGRNLAYDTAWGDVITVTYEGLETPITLTPTEKGAMQLRFEWPTELTEVEAGTILKFTFTLHGSEGGREQTLNALAKLIAA